jgi:phage terminase large subunit-like protein
MLVIQFITAIAGFQSFFIIAVLCTVHRENMEKRRYETAILEICRKNGKTWLINIIFLLLFLLEPKFSKFYSVAPDGSLREVKEAIKETISVTPALRR